jgi:mycothiol synthase
MTCGNRAASILTIAAQTTAESWAHFIGFRAFRPAYSFLAYADGEPVGMIMGQEFDAYNEAVGRRELYIPLVATRQAARKRGIASALLAKALTAAKTDGFASASLNVDADSSTGAVRLYERLGFAIKDTWITQRKVLTERHECAL